MNNFTKAEIIALKAELTTDCANCFDSFLIAEVLQSFLNAHGFQTSYEQVRESAYKLKLKKFNFQDLSTELNSLAIAS